MPLLSTFGAASARAFGNLSGIPILPSDSLWNTVSFLSHFDGTNNGVNNAFDDGSASNHTITAAGNVTQGSFGPFAREEGHWGVALDGTGDYLQAASSSDFGLGTGNFTVEAFVFANSLGATGSDYIFDFRDASNTNNPTIYIDSNNGKMDYYYGGNSITASIVFPIGEWVHVAVVKISNTVKLYQNGSQVASASASTNLGSSGTFALGARYNGNEGWNGSISNARFVKGTGVYTGAFTPTTSPLTNITNTKVLIAQSNRFVDNSSSARAITSYGNASVSAFGPFLTSEVYDPAVNGASGYFNGPPADRNLVQAAENSNFAIGTSAYTVEFWTYLEEWAGIPMRFFLMGVSGFDAIVLGHDDGTPDLWFQTKGTGSDNRSMVLNSYTPPLNQWVHIAIVRANTGTNGMSMYINGARVAQGTDANNIPAKEFNVGGLDWANGYEVDGYMSDFRFVIGTAVYSGTTLTLPTAPLAAITNTRLLLNMADAQAIDSAAQNNLTLADDVKLSTAKAKFGDTSMLFDGSGKAYIEGSNVVDFGAGDFTVEFFMNSTTGGGEEVLLDARNSNDASGPMFTLETDTSDKIVYRVNAGNRIISGSAISTDTWYHIAVCRSGTSTKLFIDGTQSGSTYSDSTVYTQPNDRFILGGYYNSATYDFDGYIDELRISKMARYTSNFTAPTEPFPDKGQ